MPGRLNLISGLKHTTLIDDTYNAAPDSMTVALQLLSQYPTGLKVAILGDMLELGELSEQAHRDMGALVSKLEINKLITVGTQAKNIARGAKAAGFDSDHIQSFPDVGRALKPALQYLAPGNVILIKGSQGVRLEKITKELMAEPMRGQRVVVQAVWEVGRNVTGMFNKTKRKIDPKIRFQQANFKQQLQTARGYKRTARKSLGRGSHSGKGMPSLKTWVITFTSLIFLAGMVYIVFLPNIFYIQHITVTGLPAEQQTEAQNIITTYLGQNSLINHQNLLFLSKARLTQTLLREDFNVYQVSAIHKRFPNSLGPGA